MTYGIATNRNGERPLMGYKPPQLVEKLPDIIVPPSQGPLESIDEVPSITTYYDGSLRLNVAEINCRIYTVPGSCVKQSQCGKKFYIHIYKKQCFFMNFLYLYIFVILRMVWR